MWSESLWGLRKTVLTGNQRQRERSGNGGRRYNKSVCISTTKVSFSTKIVWLGQCMIAIMKVQSESLYATQVTQAPCMSALVAACLTCSQCVKGTSDSYSQNMHPCMQTLPPEQETQYAIWPAVHATTVIKNDNRCTS